jgi:prephenate dehydrogenase
VTDPVGGREELLADPGDLLVLAAPPSAVAAELRGLHTDALVTDVAGVKGPVTAAGRHLARFVPGHPMAGREVGGPGAASAALFRGAAWVLVTDAAPAADVAGVAAVVETLGARPVFMTAADHDAAVAVVSHLPQVVASALVREAASATAALDLAAGGFRDLTRVAASDPGVWVDLLVANAGPVAAVLREFAGRLGVWAEWIDDGATPELLAALDDARSIRRAIAPPVVAVAVALADRPGELARVGRALEASKVDVRDLQLRHSPHGGGGVLSLYVRPGEAEPLRAALVAEDLLVVTT